MIDEGVADMNNAAVNPSKPAADDYIYKGSVAQTGQKLPTPLS
jgi:hypothetical protein